MISAMRQYRRALQVGLFLVILAFVVTSVVVFGAGGLREEQRDAVAWVNGEAVPMERYQRRYQEFVNLYAQSLQGRFTPEMAERLGLSLQVVDDLVQEALVVQRATADGLRVTDEELNAQIHGMAMFHDGGVFSLRRYDDIVRRLGYSKSAFEEDLRRKLTRGKLESAIRNGVKVTDGEVEQVYAQRHEEVRVAWALVEVAPLLAAQTATDQELEAYLSAHQSDFRQPERRRIQYVSVDPRAPGRPVGDADVERYYREHPGEFEAQPEVRAAHILVRAPEQGPASEGARQKAAEVLRRVKAGEDFGRLARELSQDPGSAKGGGDLGWIKRGEMEPAFEQAAFALKKGELAPEPVRTQHGFHVVKVTDVRPGGKRPLRDVAGTIRERLAAEAADQAARAKAEELRPKLQAAADFLAEARTLGLSPLETAIPRRAPLLGAPADPMEQAAFDLAQGGVSTPIRTPAGWVVLKALDRLPAAVPPLAEVKDRVAAAVKRQKAEAVALERARQLAAQAGPSGDLAAAARAVGASSGETGRFSRSKPPERLPGDAVLAALQTPAGSLSEPVKSQQGYYVLRVLERVPADLDGLAPERAALARETLVQKQGRVWAAWVADARARSKIEISPRFQPRRG